jgi:hypothetical protein
MSETPELDRLKDRLAGARNFHVSWGPEAHTLTPEQRAAEINKALDQRDSGAARMTGFPKSGRPKVNVRDWLASREVGS